MAGERESPEHTIHTFDPAAKYSLVVQETVRADIDDSARDAIEASFAVLQAVMPDEA